jgi:alkanesulfonate monooxygenase SsuD/methylene tetrahydromethanopterin reductase-like flavin-dependent oxidoreductase (luciferase family)
MDLDIILEPDLSPAEIAELGLLAEKLNFRAIWVQNYSSARDAFMSLVHLAQVSKNIRLGVVIVSPYEMHPMKITNAVLTLNEYAHGRAMVVVGSGGEWPQVMASEVFNSGYGQRLRNVRETLEIMKHSITEKELHYDGDAYSTRRFSTQWHTDKPPLIYHGACGPGMIRMGAGIADGIMMSDVMPKMFETRLPVLKETLYDRARIDGTFRVSNFIAWHIREDRKRSFAEARRELIIRGWLERDWLEPFLTAEETESILNNRWPFLKPWLERHGEIEDVPKHVVDTLVEELSLSGDLSDIERHLERLRAFEEAGFTEIALRIHEDPADSIRLIGERVLPEFG